MILTGTIFKNLRREILRSIVHILTKSSSGRSLMVLV